jgi:glycosyltransferase involved in cell wall biosynthesis
MHISVCICTYKRREMLRRLLMRLGEQRTKDEFTFSIVVADNDGVASARSVVSESAPHGIAVKYIVEPERSIARARNAAIREATGDFVAFIDDDEEPSSDWLLGLFEFARRSGADGVLGPVLPQFTAPPPEWVARGKFFDRASLPSGTWLEWNQTRSGNALLRRDIFQDSANAFSVQYDRGGEDVDWFRRMIAKGLRFVWCAEAIVHETIPLERVCRRYLMRRALARGYAPYNQGWVIAKSILAVPLYMLMLAASFPIGQHLFMRYLVRLCDHLGRICARCGIDVIGSGYVTR